ncbi:hypothetical protein CERZMDRAFT_90134 [Cercospora zeae-maydis SCOH1-5]|uniref:Uncharacterized protein n=1 Tax=Cercospora zeae-maydis SCOH1-5 TaxID=717836 RepID=A0A6A6FQ51_9PEZI|nr:hypothetical protein CERZMDRAFT_90134 [Cercospora zeae-maydis SCOH1-5]
MNVNFGRRACHTVVAQAGKAQPPNGGEHGSIPTTQDGIPALVFPHCLQTRIPPGRGALPLWELDAAVLPDRLPIVPPRSYMPCREHGHDVSCLDPDDDFTQWPCTETAARVECNMADATLKCGLDVCEQSDERFAYDSACSQ